MAGASRPSIPAAIPLRAGSAAERNHRRSSGTRCGAWSRRNPRRMCIRKCRCGLPSRQAEDPCRNIRSSAEVAAPWWSRAVGVVRIFANRAREANDESPSISDVGPCRHPEVRSCAPQRMSYMHGIQSSFEAPRRRLAPQDDGGVCLYLVAFHSLVSAAISAFSGSRIAEGVREKRGAGAGWVMPWRVTKIFRAAMCG